MESLITDYLQTYGLLTVLLLMLTNGFVSSPPSELVLALSGLWVSVTSFGFGEVFMAAFAGNLIGTYALYLLGRHVGDSWLYRLKSFLSRKGSTSFLGKFLPNKENIDFGVYFINQHGNFWVCTLRCMPLVRSIVSLPAGIARMKHKNFLFYSSIGVSLWIILWMSIGYFAKHLWIEYRWGLSLFFFSLLGLTLFLLKRQISQFYHQKNKSINVARANQKL